MEQFIIGTLISLAFTWLRSTAKGAKAEKAIKQTAKYILDDDGNPITDPAEALKQALIVHRSDDIARMAAELEAEQADARRDEEAATARGKAMGDGMNVTIVPPDGTEKFSRVFPDDKSKP